MGLNPYEKLNSINSIIDAISRSQQMISSNIANAHTPGYTAKSLSFSDLLEGSSPYDTKLSKQMGSSLQPLSTADTGMPVNLHQQMIEMQKNMLFYSMAVRRASSVFNGIRTASQIGR